MPARAPTAAPAARSNARTSATSSCGRPPGAGLDLGPPPIDPALVLVEPVEHPDHAVGVAGDVGEHVPDRPVGQQRRLPRVEVRRARRAGPADAGGRRRHRRCPDRAADRPSRRDGNRRDVAAGDAAIDLPIVHRAATVTAETWQPGAMQLGMIGLGRMGANMVRRLMAGGHECVGYDVERGGDRRPRRRGRPRRPHARGVRRRPRPHRATSGSWCRPRSSARPSIVWRRCSRPATRSSTAATRWYRDDVDRSGPLAARARHPLRRRRHQRRHPRPRARLLPDGRRRRRRRRPDGADLRHARARRRGGADAHPAAPATPTPPSGAGCTAARRVPDTSSRWCTTGSSTG